MNKGTHLFGQPVYGQVIKCLDKDKIIEMSRNNGGSFFGQPAKRHRSMDKTPENHRFHDHIPLL